MTGGNVLGEESPCMILGGKALLCYVNFQLSNSVRGQNHAKFLILGY